MDETAEPREQFAEVARDSDRHALYFKTETVSKIVEAAGGLGATGDAQTLQNDLETAAGQFLVLQVWASFPADRLSYLSKLENATRRVLKLVAGDENAGASDVPKGVPQHILAALDTPQYGTELDLDKIDIAKLDSDLEKFQQLIAAAAWFRDRTSEARVRLEESDAPRMNPRVKCPITSSPEAWLICKALPEIYEQHFRPFGVTTTKAAREKAKGGPGVRFIQQCLAALEVNKKPDAIKKMWQRYRATGDTDS